MAHHRTQRLFRDDLGQNDVVSGGRQGGAGGREARGVGGVGVARTSQELTFRIGVVGHVDRRVLDVVGLEEVGQVQLGRGAGLDADRRAVEFLGRRNAEVFLHHEALTVIVVHRDEIEFQIGVARKGPGRVPHQQINLARGQRGEAGFTGGGDVLDLALVAEDRSRDGLAQVNVEALVIAVRIRRAKARQTGVGPAVQHAARLDVVQRRGTRSAGKQRRRGQRAKQYRFFHGYLILLIRPARAV